jgi:membrane protein
MTVGETTSDVVAQHPNDDPNFKRPLAAAASAGETPDTRHTLDMDKVYGPIGYLKELFTRFGSDQCGAWAASLSFFSILSIAPILLCGMAVLGFAMHSAHEAALRVQHIISQIVPDKETAKQIVLELNVEKSADTLIHSRGKAGVIGVLSLFWAALQIFVNASAPMNAAFRTRESRNWLNLRLTSLALLLGAGLLFLLSLACTTIVHEFSSIVDHLQFVKHDHTGTIAAVVTSGSFFLGLVLSLAANAAMFAIIYKYLPAPPAEVRWKAAALSGTIIAILWEVAKQAFAIYLARFANYNKLYGTFGGLVALIFWIYYSSMILLLGAEIAKLYQDAQDARKARAAKAAETSS